MNSAMLCCVYFYPASEVNLRFSLVFTMIMSWNLLIAAAVVSVTASANTNALSCYKISISTFCLEFYNTTILETAEQEHAVTLLSYFQPI